MGNPGLDMLRISVNSRQSIVGSHPFQAQKISKRALPRIRIPASNRSSSTIRQKLPRQMGIMFVARHSSFGSRFLATEKAFCKSVLHLACLLVCPSILRITGDIGGNYSPTLWGYRRRNIQPNRLWYSCFHLQFPSG
jgi:hypothetical protein